MNHSISSWIEDSQTKPIHHTKKEKDNEAHTKIFKSTFLLNGRVSHLDRVNLA